MRRGSLEQQLATLAQLERAALLQQYARLWKGSARGPWSEEQLRLAISYRLQERLIAILRSKAMDAIQASEVIVSSLSRDSRHHELIRRWKGRVVTVSLVGGRAIYRDKTYRSLSEVGEVITGSRQAGDQLLDIQPTARGRHGKARR